MMRRSTLGWTALIAGMLLSIQSARAQDALGYALPADFLPTPLSSTRPEEGFYTGGSYAMYIQTMPLRTQKIAVRGFLDIDGSITGIQRNFVGSGREALTTKFVTGPRSQQPGFTVEAGYRFYDGGALQAKWLHLSTIRYSAIASILPSDFVVRPDLSDTFLSAPVYNFIPEFGGPANDVQGGGAFGVWNAADLMTIDFTQRNETFELIYRLPPIIENYTFRAYNYFGPRFVWFWERFRWRTYDFDIDGGSADVWNAVYTNIVSNRMYGMKIGCGSDWYIGNGLSVNFDAFVTPMIDIIKKRAKYERGDRRIGPERKRADVDYQFVPELGASLNLNWFPYEGIQVKAGYNFQAYFNTLTSEHPIDFDYNRINPEYDRAFRILRGFELGIAFRF